MKNLKTYEQYLNTTDDFMNNPVNYKFNALKDLKDDMKLKLKQFIGTDFDSLSDTQLNQIAKLTGIPKEKLVNELPSFVKDIKLTSMKTY